MVNPHLQAPKGSVAAFIRPVAIGSAAEWLVEHFGESAKRIPGFSAWGRETISGAYFVIDDDGGLFVLCGGQAVIALRRDHTVDKRPLYLVIDGSAGAVAELRRGNGTQPLHESHPRDRLKLVMCA